MTKTLEEIKNEALAFPIRNREEVDDFIDRATELERKRIIKLVNEMRTAYTHDNYPVSREDVIAAIEKEDEESCPVCKGKCKGHKYTSGAIEDLNQPNQE